MTSGSSAPFLCALDILLIGSLPMATRPTMRTTAPRWSRVALRHFVALLLLVIVLFAASMGAGTPTPAWAAPPVVPSSTDAQFSSSVPLRVATFNVRCANCYEGINAEVPWTQRRAAVVSTIRSQDLDVLGIQEASQGKLKGVGGEHGLSQFEDLLARLGSPWKMTNTARYNCANKFSPSGCDVTERGASLGTRILYNSDRVAVIDSGSKLLPETNEKGTRHFVTWAHLQQVDTGIEFIVSNAHFTAYPENHALRTRQAEFALAEVLRHNREELPLIALGDWNSGRAEPGGNGPYDVYTGAGLVDPLGAKPGLTTTAPTATVEKRISTWLNSFNGWQRHAPGNQGWVNGNYYDYILTSPMRVSEWATVANLDSGGNIIGTIPSDHNLVRATLWLPTP